MEKLFNFEDLKIVFKEKFPGAEITEGTTWCNARYSSQYPSQVHYELIQRGTMCFVEFHVEMKNFTLEAQINNSLSLRDYARLSYYANRYWQLRTPVLSVEDLENDIARMREAIESCLPPDKSRTYELQENSVSPDVGVCELTLSKILKENLCIPSYQRGYCWTERNVRDLLVGICKWFEDKNNEYKFYHLGTAIVRESGTKSEKKYDVIDGQQRLTTLAILLYLNDEHQVNDEHHGILSSKLMQNNLTTKVKNAIITAKRTIDSLGNEQIKKLADYFDKILLSVVVIGKNQPEDLAYTFFSNSNSTGKNLSDYDLLKTHHLRFLKEEKYAEKAVKYWHEMEADNKLDELLHQNLFRLRNWRSGTSFLFHAADSETRSVFRHFAADLEVIPGFSSQPSERFQFDSILSGGKEFFQYTKHYYRQYSFFSINPVIKDMVQTFLPHSNGVICSGIRAISFLFYCKFGDTYLSEAAYCIAYYLSQIRNESQVRRQYINSEPFLRCTRWLDLSTSEGMFFAMLMNPKEKYIQKNDGNTAKNYWTALNGFLERLQEQSDFSIPEAYRVIPKNENKNT